MKIDGTVSAGKTQISMGQKRFISKQAAQNAKELLRRMNSETVYVENEAQTGWTSNILASLSYGKKIKFIDNRMYKRPTENPEKHPFDCTLEINGTTLNIDSETGLIVEHTKGIFKTWFTIYKQANNYIKMFLENFDNKEVVTKNSFAIAGYTPKGRKIAQEAQFRIKK